MFKNLTIVQNFKIFLFKAKRSIKCGLMTKNRADSKRDIKFLNFQTIITYRSASKEILLKKVANIDLKQT